MWGYGEDFDISEVQDPYEEHFESSFIPEDYYPEMFEVNKSVKNVDLSPRLINFQDYTLNSPLIPDDLESFRDSLKKMSSSENFKGVWSLRKKAIDTASVPLNEVRAIRDFHSFMAGLFRKDGVYSNRFLNLLKSTDENAKETFEVVQAYLHSWIDKVPNFQSRLNNGPEIIKYGSYMLDCLYLTWLLNASTVTELKNLKDSINFDFVGKPESKKKEKQNNTLIYHSDTMGDIMVGYGICYFFKHKILADRNMVLLLKDTSTARFHTLFAIEHREFEHYRFDHGEKINTMYKLGDLVLSEKSSNAYDIFSMIEPITSYRLSELARLHRSKIPSFPHFSQHIEKKTSELQMDSEVTKSFFEHLLSLDDKRILLTAYGAFRHWGHPFIDYLEGLQALHDNVTKITDIDEGYANLLASDLAYKILEREFVSKKTWYVDKDQVSKEHPFHRHITQNTWPSANEVMEFKGYWHDLPLLPCWEIPEVVDPTIIYSDKSHSMNRSEILDHVRRTPKRPIQTRRVLETFLKTGATDWPSFLQFINDFGLTSEELVIGLKAKERELKRKGRFFALMSWKLREYFVFTEYLIKRHVLPLFSSLTMADDQTTLTKKMLENTSGQGWNHYENVTIANHIDYNKWNNFQRKKATNPAFTVIGRFFGFPNLFARTHEFFEESLIYYRDRPDLMSIEGNSLVPTDPTKIVCWNGQLGGLEGLRQKGWSVLNLLVIERESQIRNTKVQILAQGDNQVICTKYHIHPHNTPEELEKHLKNAISNNGVIMDRIRMATGKIGLFINEDETLQSADMLIYGKNIVYRGNMTCLEEKRYSRITCTTNDQLPGLGNIMATVSTNCLTVSHFSNSPLNAIVNYNWLGNFVISILNLHNPALRSTPEKMLNKKHLKWLKGRAFRIALLYLDPSLGGISGMSLARFHIRMFPDPVTEGLAFWKAVHKSAKTTELKRLACSFGNPQILNFEMEHFDKLVENPISLNLPRSLSVTNVLRDEIRRQLINDIPMIVNKIVQDAVLYVKDQSAVFMSYLQDIEPCFPRFLCEFKAATYLGVTESLVGLFENSNTIRTLLKDQMSNKIDRIIISSELKGIVHIIETIKNDSCGMWECSSAHADSLRTMSWMRPIVGTTIPHPLEMLNKVHPGTYGCPDCSLGSPYSVGIKVIIPHGLIEPGDTRGPYPPYFGSTTDENTSLLQSWEKSTDITFVRRASELRRAFSWFVDPNSPLGRTINLNLKSMTGEDPGLSLVGFKRTGSAIHRFGCSRVSAGGYMANNPVYGSRMIISSDPFVELGRTNYDFMFQSLMLYAQQTAGELHIGNSRTITYHFHRSCEKCFREVHEIQLNNPREFSFSDRSQILNKWKPSSTEWFKTLVSLPLREGNWTSLKRPEQSYEIGKLQGLIFTELYREARDSPIISNLFPIGIRDKLQGYNYLEGIKDGLMRGSLQSILHRSLFYKIKKFDEIALTCYKLHLYDLVTYGNFLVFCQGKDISQHLSSYSHRIPASYPTNATDLGSNVSYYLQSYSLVAWKNANSKVKTWIFADFVSVKLSGFLVANHKLVSKILFKCKGKEMIREIKALHDVITAVKTDKVASAILQWCADENVLRCNSEVRAAAQDILETKELKLSMPRIFTNKLRGDIYHHRVLYINAPTDRPIIHVPQIKNPLISAIRVVQLATGAWYKLQVILQHLKIEVSSALCVGDGSGGISALILRMYPSARLIFNSLLDMGNVVLGGSLPKPPAALAQMDSSVFSRCVNLNTAAELPSDLTKEETWEYFVKLKGDENMQLNLMVMDMEVTSEDDINKIDSCLKKYVCKLLIPTGTLIVKTYLSRLISENSILETLGKSFASVTVCQTDWSGSHTSEIYVIMRCYLKTSKVQSTYVDWDNLKSFNENIFCLLSYEKEFCRAVKMIKQNTELGIPACFLPDPFVELSNLLHSCGCDPTTITRWLEILKPEVTSNSVGWATATLIILSLDVIDITHLICVRRKIPSDNQLEKFFAFYVASWLYSSLISENPCMGELINQLVNTSFPISFYWIPVLDLGGNQVGENIGWKFGDEGPVVKIVHLQRKMGLICQILRTWIRLSKNLESPNSRYYYIKLFEVKRTITIKDVINHTGIYHHALLAT